jgi:hypothetical protein
MNLAGWNLTFINQIKPADMFSEHSTKSFQILDQVMIQLGIAPATPDGSAEIDFDRFADR